MSLAQSKIATFNLVFSIRTRDDQMKLVTEKFKGSKEGVGSSQNR